MINVPSTMGWLPALFDIAVISLDSTGTVMECSEPALAVLANGGLSLSEGRLTAHHPEDQAQLQRLLDRATAMAANRAAARGLAESARATPGGQNHHDLRPLCSLVGAIHIARPDPLPALQAVLTTACAAAEQPAGGQPALMLFLCDPARQHSSRAQVLRSLYRLTPTEMRLIDQLVSGAKLKRAAKALNLTENTARFHLKEVFRKMRVDCQSALLSTILLLPSVAEVSACQGAHAAETAAYPAEPVLASSRYRVTAPLKTKRPPAIDPPGQYRAMNKMFA